ncbi:Alpha/Beta hydrolase protein [Kockovaella imperatae]|uniref:Alpha/Beta hydrolase protein n=1 Tax=Kockovaella imperatae TaxID=4999 RepID=A0A1Y1UG64_9TREE|nr:Alpha/Beta hydrolase protein [Kockovaella imperatae]ORX37018.1 Alpha/Beta hydrolase protein [Kockovaella imperatae]
MVFEGFESFDVKVDSACLGEMLSIHGIRKGRGPPLLLLHGYPQTLRIWNKIANVLAEAYTVIATDLRGYGQSDKPSGSSTHVEYSKREMASDPVQVMSRLGYETFYLVAHDR